MIGSIARIALAVTFGLAGLQKMLHWRASVRAVVGYDLVPRSLAMLVAYSLPMVEVVLALLLLSGRWPGIAAGGSIVLTMVFAAAVGTNLARDRRVPCGCWGGAEDISAQSLVRLVTLAAMGAAYGWANRWGSAPAATLTVITLVTAGIVTAQLIVADRLLVQVMPRRGTPDEPLTASATDLVIIQGGMG